MHPFLYSGASTVFQTNNGTQTAKVFPNVFIVLRVNAWCCELFEHIIFAYEYSIAAILSTVPDRKNAKRIPPLLTLQITRIIPATRLSNATYPITTGYDKTSLIQLSMIIPFRRERKIVTAGMTVVIVFILYTE